MKTTLIEFLDKEPIENVITCIDYKIDKVIFIGEQEDIQFEKDEKIYTSSLKWFLKTICHVETIRYQKIPHYDLQGIINTLKKVIESEKSEGNRVFFDVTGGKEIPMIAIGILSKIMETPMHIYDIPTGKLMELEEGAKESISEVGIRHNPKIKLTLESMIRLYGGIIVSHDSHKAKSILNTLGFDTIKTMVKYNCDNPVLWEKFTAIINNKSSKIGTDNKKRRVKKQDICDIEIDDFESFCIFLKDVKALDAFLSDENKDSYRLDFVSEDVWKLFKTEDMGVLLESYEYSLLKEKSDENMMGVHLDWDGEIRLDTDGDVANEVDGLALKGYIMEYVSCKMGNDRVHEEALYELNTIADRLGGKYVKKTFSTTRQVSFSNRERAKVLGIEVRYVGEDFPSLSIEQLTYK